jgi:hypothetical protein
MSSPDGTKFRLVFCPRCGEPHAILESYAQGMFYLRDTILTKTLPAVFCPKGCKWHYLSLDEIETLKSSGKTLKDGVPRLSDNTIIDAILAEDKEKEK